MHLEMAFKASIIIFIFFNILLCIDASGVLVSNKIYFIGNDRFLTWDAASVECHKMGMDLVSIKSSEELSYLKEYIKQKYGIIFPYWLGAHKVNDQFQWSATGEKIDQFFWHEGEPNNKSGHENCIHTWQEFFDWNDNDCERQLSFICAVDYSAVRDKIYYIENERFLTWHAASEECHKMGMNLLSLKSEKELEYLKNHIKQKYVTILPYWLGAYKVNDQFHWSATGEIIDQFFWHEDEPNNKSGRENCIHTWEEYFDWNDNDCERQLPFICDLNV